MKLLITGGTGYIARNIIIKLKTSYTIATLSRDSSVPVTKENPLYNGVMVFSYSSDNLIEDVTRAVLSFDPDVVVHTSSFISSSENIHVLKELIDANVYFGTVLLEVLSKSKSNKFINLSSYGQHFFIDNNSIGNSLYATTKEAFEKILLYFSLKENIQVVNLILQHVYGRDEDKRIVYKIIKSIKEKEDIYLSAGEQVFDFIHIDDVVDAIEHAIIEVSNSHPDKLSFNSYGVGTKKSTSLQSLVEHIRLFLEIPEKILKWGKVDYRKFEFFKIWEDYSFIPGWSPKITLEEGIKKTLDEKWHE
jgi:nucleoside-diphosphate-sugar epimerase